MREPIQPTDVDKKLIDLRRRQAQAGPLRARERPDKEKSPQLVVDDFSRKLTLSPQKSKQAKLFDPTRDPIPVRRTAEPETLSDAPSASHTHARARPDPSRQLFDHRKDDPVRFSVLARPNGRPVPTPKSSGDFSASSASSYAPSIASSSFTLSSNTDGSSTPSALFDQNGESKSDRTNIYSAQLKKLYRVITTLESQINQEPDSDGIEENSRVLLKGKEPADDESEKTRWRKQLENHKQLIENIHNLLEISQAPKGPLTVRNIPTKYNMIVRLWTYGFHKLLESLRRASFTSTLAFEHLQDFIYYAYTYYGGLYEEPHLNPFRSGWVEALGDLARYRWAVAAMVANSTEGGAALTQAAVKEVDSNTTDPDLLAPPEDGAAKSVSNKPAARIDESPSPSVGVAAARLMEVEPDKERWRCIAREWYSAGLVDQPGTGKLHHHLGTLSRDGENEELRGVYHFVKSLTVIHPFSTSREAILPIWSVSAQAKRSQPDARASDLFVLLHGMLFTNIQLDDFQPTLARFIERLHIEGAEEREWIMMAIVNITSVLEYGRASGVLKKAAAAVHVLHKPPEEDNKMDVDEEHPQTSSDISDAEPAGSDYPTSFVLAQQLTFSMLSFVLRNPTRKATPFSRTAVNPYLSVLLTFLTTTLKHPQSLTAMERHIPWQEIAAFFSTISRNIMKSQGLLHPVKPEDDRWVMLTSGTAPPLPEDWCLRGMEWIGRKVYERGFWKSGEERKAELEVLDTIEVGDLTDGRIEDDDEDEETTYNKSDFAKRWIRITRCAVGISNLVDGFNWVEGTKDWKIEGVLAQKVETWKEEDKAKRAEEERRRTRRRWTDDAMDIDDDAMEESASEDDSEDDENDSEEVRQLKARRRYLKSLLQSEKKSFSPVRQPRRTHRKSKSVQASLKIIPGYTVLIVDTNILLSSLSMFASVVESFHWTVVVPLPVIMELEGLSSNSSPQLAEAAQSAMAYISSHFRSHSTSLKVQTSKGNYLTSLGVRTEQVDFENGSSERNMDDLILNAAIWQDEHWVDRSALLKAEVQLKDTSNAVKVVLLSLDRNLRLKAKSRQLPAAGQKDLARILSRKT